MISRTRATVATILTASLAFAGLISMPVAASAAPVVATSTTAAALPVPDGTISGFVTTTAKKAIVGATVEAYRYDEETDEVSDEPVASTTSAAKGAYSLAVSEGYYFVKFVAPLGTPAYVDEYWKNGETLWSSDLVWVDAGKTVTKITGTLAASSFITGSVVAHDGESLAPSDISIDVCTVDVYEDFDEVYSEVECGFGRATIDADGKYTVSNLGAGTYTVYVNYDGAGNYKSAYYPGVENPEDSTTFKVKSGATVKGKNFVLDAGATVSGTITGEGVGAISGATVDVYASSYDAWEDVTYVDETALKSATTNAEGDYTLTGLWDDTYYLNARDAQFEGTSFAAEWFDNALSSSRATPLAVTAARPIETDIELSVAAELTGTVVDVAEAPVAGITVTLFRAISAKDNRNEYIAEATTGADGSYSFDTVPTGDYFIRVAEFGDDEDSEYQSARYLTSYYGALPSETIHQATRVALAAGDNGPLTLPITLGGSYTGIITADGVPLADALVTATAEADASDDYEQGTFTDENGVFTLTGLDGGAYTLTVNGDGFEGDEETGEGEYRQFETLTFVAPPVAVDSEPVDVGELELLPSNELTGVVTGSTGKPVGNAELTAYAKENGEFTEVDYAYTDAKGRYAFTDLPSGTVYVQLFASGYPVQYAGGTDTREYATPVTVQGGGSTQNRDIQLYKGASVGGTVRDSVTGRVIPNIFVVASKHSRDAGYGKVPTHAAVTTRKGTYTLPGLTAGSYDVGANTYDFYGSGSKYGSSTNVVNVTAKDAKSNFTLDPRVRVSGIVTGANGEPLAGVSVLAYPTELSFDDLSFLDAAVQTDSRGRYTLLVTRGSYFIEVTDPERDYATTYLGDTVDAEDATVIDAERAPITGVDVRMASFPGRVSATLAGEFDNNLEAWIDFERTPLDGGDTTYDYAYTEGESPDSFEVSNLRTGNYTFEIGAYDYDGELATYEGSFTITDEEPVVDLGEIDLGESTPLSNDEPGNTGVLPTITETEPTVGDVLTVDNGEWDDEIIGFDYQWFRGDRPIAGAIGNTYAVAPGDAGHKLSVRLIPLTNTSWIVWPPEYVLASNIVTEPTAPVLKGAAANAYEEPVITGETRVGQTLTLTAGEWDLPGLSFAYSWVRTTGEKTKVVSTKATYKPVIADITNGSSLSATVTVTRAGFESTSRTVEVGDIQPAAALTQTKKSVVTFDETTDTYSVTPGTWSPKGATISYQWFLSDEEGEGGAGEGSSYTTNPGQEHFALSVKVTATKPGYATTTVEYLARPLQQLEWLDQPTTSGTNQVGGVLTINTNGAATEPEATGYTFEWRVDGTVVTGATKSSYSPTKAGGEVTAVVTATRAKNGSVSTEPLLFGVTTTGGNFEGELSVSGNPAIGHTLTADLSDVSPTATTATFQWFRVVDEGTPVKIAKATKATYVPTVADYESELVVTATLVRAGYTKTELSATSHPIEARTPSGETQIVTSARVGTPITAVAGEWDVVGASFTYQWTVNGTEIAGATSPSYTPIAEDLDEDLAVVVTARIAGVAPGVATSNSVTVEAGAAPKPTKAPAITVGGKSVTKTTLGKTLVASTGTWKKSGLAFSHQWQVSDGGEWVDIEGATSKTLKLSADAFASGSKVRVVVVATAAGYATSSPAASKTITVK